MHKLFGLVILAPVFVLLCATSVLARDFVCPDDGIPGNGAVINENFIVPKGAACRPGDGVVFRKDVTVKQNGSFTVFGMTVIENFEAESGSSINIGASVGARSVVVQSAKFKKSAFVRLCNMHVEQDLELEDVKNFRVGSNVPTGRVFQCLNLINVAIGVYVGQNFEISKSTGVVGQTTVEEDFQCDDESAVTETVPGVSVGGDNGCNTL